MEISTMFFITAGKLSVNTKRMGGLMYRNNENENENENEKKTSVD